MRNFVAIVGAAALLAGCGAGRSLDRARPDEFAVARQPPLVIPPDYALRGALPNRASTVSCWLELSCGRAVPGCGGTSA